MTPRLRQIAIDAAMATFWENAARERLVIPDHEALAAVTAAVDTSDVVHIRALLERYRRQPKYQTVEPKALPPDRNV